MHGSTRAPAALPAWLHWQDARPVACAHAPTPAVFRERWGAPGLPVKLTGLTDDWPARTRWTFAFFARAYGACEVAVEARADASATRQVRLADYLATLADRGDVDGERWYLKDWVFRQQAPALLDDYRAPPQFPDYFAELEPALQPGFSWIYIGPRDSASNFHRDVAGTSAWNALIRGRKLWLFFPPDAHAAAYDNTLDAFARDAPPAAALAAREPLYCIQEPGETVFTPSLWWHQVYNLEDSIAVTENFVDDCNLSQVLRGLRERPGGRHTALALALLVGCRRPPPIGARR
ncbi:MAG: cupin-like domain-containing protein [Gammaproteobacteria bacterium]